MAHNIIGLMDSNGSIKVYGDSSGGGGASTAEDVSYDNTDSGLEADNVQAAIDELKSDIDVIQPTSDAEDVNYDNTDSGLTATNVQDAIDEVVEKSISIKFDGNTEKN